MPEQTSLGDLAHQEVHDYRELVHGLVETGGSLRGRGPTDSLLQVCMRRRVVELDCLYTAQVIMVPRKLWAACGGRECGFCNKLVCLVVQTVLDVASQKAVDERCLSSIVVSQGRCTLSSEE